MAIDGLICQGCGVEALAKYVEFHQNIGALIVRFNSSAKGNMCKRCVHAQFWKRTLVTAGIGWFGTLSFIIAPIFVIMNIVRYCSALGMPGVPAGATKPVLTPRAIAAIEPFSVELIDRLNRKEHLVAIAQEMAPRAGVTPGQVVLYVVALAQASRQAAPVKTYGFPVGQARPPALPSEPRRVLPLPPV
ncbi:MAG TPA: hypothetical protein VFE47_09250 [Tepidisphaeraceae bacterium]|nr:hypothetical protein [Tepidisphaeraceae bacterium]